MKMIFNGDKNDYDDVITCCDIYKCEDCPRMGDDCDGEFEDEDEE